MATSYILLAWLVSLVQGAVVIYELPHYLGQSLTISTTDNFIAAYQQWGRPIGSVVVDEGYQFITHDDQGNMAVWNHSTILLGNWTYTIASFQVNQSVVAVNSTGAIEAPWSFLATPEGFMMVRNSSQNPGNPECYSNDGVNCFTSTNVNGLLSLPATSSEPLYPAQCGTQHIMYWGTTGYEEKSSWCNLAIIALSPASPRSNWQCYNGLNAWYALSNTSTGYSCISAGQPSQSCTPFLTQSSCNAVSDTTVGQANSWWVFDCGSFTSCTSAFTGTDPTSPTSASVTWGVVSIGIILIAFGVLAIAGRRGKLPRQSNVEATYCSSVGGDDLEAGYTAPPPTTANNRDYSMKLALATTLIASTAAVEFRFTNKCSYTIDLRGPGGVKICEIQPGQTKGGNCGLNIKGGQTGLFKHTESNEANLLEYALNSQVWYDISNIPPGPGNCGSYEDCKKRTGKTGYNVPMSLTPTKHNNGQNCKSLTVTAADAPDAYLFPDDRKTHDCPVDEVFDVTYCPGGNGGASNNGGKSAESNNGGSCSTQSNTDFFGNDLFNFNVWGSSNDQINQCCGKCQATSNCAAYSIANNVCYIKSAGSPSTKNGVTSGLKAGNCAGVEWNRDYWGNDIRNFAVSGDANYQASLCCSACSATSNCKGYTVNNGQCYLKHTLANQSWSPTAFSGRRN